MRGTIARNDRDTGLLQLSLRTIFVMFTIAAMIVGSSSAFTVRDARANIGDGGFVQTRI